VLTAFWTGKYPINPPAILTGLYSANPGVNPTPLEIKTVWDAPAATNSVVSRAVWTRMWPWDPPATLRAFCGVPTAWNEGIAPTPLLVKTLPAVDGLKKIVSEGFCCTGISPVIPPDKLATDAGVGTVWNEGINPTPLLVRTLPTVEGLKKIVSDGFCWTGTSPVTPPAILVEFVEFIEFVEFVEFVELPTVTSANDVWPVPPWASARGVTRVRDVAAAAPRLGVTSVGEVARTLVPVPVFEIVVNPPAISVWTAEEGVSPTRVKLVTVRSVVVMSVALIIVASTVSRKVAGPSNTDGPSTSRESAVTLFSPSIVLSLQQSVDIYRRNIQFDYSLFITLNFLRISASIISNSSVLHAAWNKLR